MPPDTQVDHPIKEHVVSAGEHIVHLYYFVGDDWEKSELTGLGPVQMDQEHIHLFLNDHAVYLLRTDGRAASHPELNEGQTIDLSAEVVETVIPFIKDYNKDQLAPIMAAPIDIQLRWYNYVLDRRGDNDVY